jgi:hypothetical protein
MPAEHLKLQLLPERLAICRLPADAALPQWATAGFFSFTRTSDEVSVVAEEISVPSEMSCYRGYRALRVRGTLPPDLVGILASLLNPLTEAGIAVFAVSTYDTDYILVRQIDLDAAIAAWHAAGHTVG